MSRMLDEAREAPAAVARQLGEDRERWRAFGAQLRARRQRHMADAFPAGDRRLAHLEQLGERGLRVAVQLPGLGDRLRGDRREVRVGEHLVQLRAPCGRDRLPSAFPREDELCRDAEQLRELACGQPALFTRCT